MSGAGVRGRGEAGTTLVELLVTIVIMGVAFGALLTGVATSEVSSDANRKQATSATLLRSWAETLGTAYLPCTAGSSAAPAYTPPAVPGGYSASVVSVQFANTAQTAFSGSCPAAGDAGTQLVALTAATADHRAAANLTVVIRDRNR